jgi:hypothetical protein
MRSWFNADDGPTSSRPRPRRYLSEQALRLHTVGVLSTFGSERQRFVSDEYLNGVAMDTTTAGIELVVNRLWQRAGDGYFVEKSEFDSMVEIIDAQLRELSKSCALNGGHVRSEESPQHCARCMAPIGDGSI